MHQDREKYQVEIPDCEYYKKLIKCQDACPVDTPSGSYVTAIASGNYEKAYTLARGPNPFVAICAWVCNHPCEAACRRSVIDDPISIRALKRFAVEQFSNRHKDNYVEKSLEASTVRQGTREGTSPKVAIIGSGPAGMAAAHDLACLGYHVTVFEALPVIGGMFHIGIPSYRLPRDIIKMDVDAIRKLGIEVQTHTRVGRDITISKLREYGFEAIVVAVGAQLSRSLPIGGVELEGVLKGISFLQDVYIGGASTKLGDKVLVIGGGNVAIDVARTAARMGPKGVHMVCLESREEMPADKLEIEEAEEEGVILHPGLGPRKIVGSGGKANGLECIKVASVFDKEGRFNPTFVEGTETTLKADTVIITIGQASDTSWAENVEGLQFTRWGTMVVDKDTLSTSIPGIFGAGDVATGPGIAIGAVASGKRAAQSVDEYLRGKKTKTEYKAKMTVIRSHKMVDGYEKIGLRDVPVVSPEKRIKDFEGIEIGYSEGMAVEQGKRCLRCNINTIFDSDKCILCGGCVDVCPEYCYKMVRVEDIAGNDSLEKLIEARYGASLDEGVAMIKDEDRCIRCGLCARRCPVKAITMELFEFEEVVSQ